MKKTELSDLKIGSYLSETQYYRVTGISFDGKVTVMNERGLEFKVSREIVEEGMYSADQALEIKPVTRTELIEIFSHVGDTVFTVCYNKQTDVKDIIKVIDQSTSVDSHYVLGKKIKEAFKGEERILTGYLLSTETGFGRSIVIDLALDRGTNINWDARIRQVDHRSLNWLVHKNVKYTVKK